MRRGFFSKSEIGDVVLARRDDQVSEALGGLITAKESAYSKLGKALTNHDVFYTNLANRKKRIATELYMKSVKMLGRLLLGPASELNTPVAITRAAITGRANPPANNNEAQADYNHVIADNNIADAILRKFGGFKIKSQVANALIATFDWLQHEIKKEVGVNIEEEVIDKIRKPGTTVPPGNRANLVPAVDIATFGNAGGDAVNQDDPWRV